MRYSSTRARYLLLALVSISLLSTVACRRGEDRDPIPPYGPETAGRDFFPLAVGQWREYDVTEHIWRENSDSVSHYLTRERVDTVFRGATGEWNYRIVRARRPDTLHVWRDDSVVSVIVNAAEVRETFANVPRIALLFGIWEGRTWNPGLYSGDSTVRTYHNVDAPVTLSTGQSFAHTVRVVDEPDISILGRREQEQIYARGVGRIFRRRAALDFCNSEEVRRGLCELGSGYVVRGPEREELLIDWGPR